MYSNVMTCSDRGWSGHLARVSSIADGVCMQPWLRVSRLLSCRAVVPARHVSVTGGLGGPAECFKVTHSL